MLGTVVNSVAVIAGSAVGLTLARGMSERFKAILMQALGLAVLLLGTRMALAGERVLLVVGSLIVGSLIGEGIDIEHWLAVGGEKLRKSLGEKLGRSSSTFVEGFVTASILYVTGAMMIVGSIQDGTMGNPSTLYVKALLDGVASIALASSLGAGVAFSALSVFLCQGAVTLLASKLVVLQEPSVLEAINSTGGVLIMGIGINLLGAANIRVGNLMPAVFVALGAALWV